MMMNKQKIIGNSEEARLIIDTILNTEEGANLILECLERNNLTGDKLVSYFEDNFIHTEGRYEDDVHLFADAVRWQTTSHHL